MSSKSLRAASIAMSLERTNCQYVLLMSSQMYSTKYVVFVSFAVSIVVIILCFYLFYFLEVSKVQIIFDLPKLFSKSEIFSSGRPPIRELID